jgi:hypothetical protein
MSTSLLTCPTAAPPSREQLLARRWLRPPLTALARQYAERLARVLRPRPPLPDPVLETVLQQREDAYRVAVAGLVAPYVAALAQLVVLETGGPPEHAQVAVRLLGELLEESVVPALAREPLPWQRRRGAAPLTLVRE